MDFPKIADRPVADFGMEIFITYQPGKYFAYGFYSVDGVVFLIYELQKKWHTDLLWWLW